MEMTKKQSASSAEVAVILLCISFIISIFGGFFLSGISDEEPSYAPIEQDYSEIQVMANTACPSGVSFIRKMDFEEYECINVTLRQLYSYGIRKRK